MTTESNIFRIVGPAEGCQIANVVIAGANYDYCNKINGKYIRTVDVENNYNIFVKEDDEDVKLHYVLRTTGMGIGWKISNSQTGFDYCYVMNNQTLWYEYKYLSRNNSYLHNTDIYVENFSENIQNEQNDLNEDSDNILDITFDESSCVICLSAPPTFGILHQGNVHLCMCRSCSQLFSDTSCPVCRLGVERVVRIYV